VTLKIISRQDLRRL